MAGGYENPLRIRNEAFEFRYSTAGRRAVLVLKDLPVALPVAASVRLGRKLATTSRLFNCTFTADRARDALGLFQEAVLVFRRGTADAQLIWHIRLYAELAASAFSIEVLNTTRRTQRIPAVGPLEFALGEMPCGASLMGRGRETPLGDLAAGRMCAGDELVLKVHSRSALALGFATRRCPDRLVRTTFRGEPGISCLCRASAGADGVELAPAGRLRSDVLFLVAAGTAGEALGTLADIAGRYREPPLLWGS